MKPGIVSCFCAAGLSVCAGMRAQQPVELAPGRVQQIAAMLPATPAGLDVPCHDRAVWAERADQLSTELRRANGLAGQPMPAWNEEDYLDFGRTGQRPRGEAMLHARQDRLTPLVLAECSEWKGRFLPALTATLEGLAEQPTWTLPAHDVDLSSLHRKRYRVELNSTVLAEDLAEALYLLGDAIPEETRQHVREAIRERTLDPARAIFAGTSTEFWLRGNSNWNAVCLDGVTGAALALLPSREDRAYFAAVAEAYSQNYLKSFTADGYGEEGIGYWGYGFTHYALLRETLLQQTDGQLDLFRNPLVQQIALFGRRSQMLPGVVADFGDAHFELPPNAGLIAYSDYAYGLDPHAPTMRQHPLGASLAGIMAAWNLARPLVSKEGIGPQDGMLRHDFPIAGVVVSRPGPQGGIAATIKGGGNGGHSHNDMGSFAIALGNTQLLGDPGGPMAYTADTFTTRRFESKLLNSYGHPVPVIAGRLQKDATSVSPSVLSKQFTADADEWTLDMTSVYPVPAMHSFTRTMRHIRAGQGQIEIIDRFDFETPTEVEESLPTHGKMTQLDADTFLFASADSAVKVKVQTPAGLRVHEERIDEYGNPFLRVGLATTISGKGEIVILIKPLPTTHVVWGDTIQGDARTILATVEGEAEDRRPLNRVLDVSVWGMGPL